MAKKRTAIDFRVLRQDVEIEVVPWAEAIELILSQPKPWSTADWKRRRDERIGSECEQCGSLDPPFVLQHFSHPLAVRDIMKPYEDQYISEYRRDHPIPHPVYVEPEALANPHCPQCGSYRVAYRKTRDIWVCLAQKNNVKCRAEFAAPDYDRVLSVAQNASYELQRHAMYLEWKKGFEAAYGQFYGVQAVLEIIDYWLDYLSFRDTATFCRTCTYRWDKQGLRLCRVCRKEYHPIQYQNCRECYWKSRSGDEV